MKAKIIRFLRQVKGLFPTRLPVGMQEFESWVDEFVATYTLATDNRESVKFTLCSVIINLAPQISHKPMYFFYKTFQAGAAKQVAGAIFYDIKQKQKEALKAAEQEAKAGESVTG